MHRAGRRAAERAAFCAMALAVLACGQAAAQSDADAKELSQPGDPHRGALPRRRARRHRGAGDRGRR